jgi:hypothetical protein
MVWKRKEDLIVISRCPSCKSLIEEIEGSCPYCGFNLKEEKSNKWLFAIVSIIVIILILAIIIVINPIPESKEQEEEPIEGIMIDGEFDDWDDVVSTADGIEGPVFNSNVDIVNYRVDNRSSKMSFYLEAQGEILSGEPNGEKHVDTSFIFIDCDQSPDTGYYIKGIGADFLIEICCWDGQIVNSNLYRYSVDSQDWNFWIYKGTVEAAVSGSELEAQVTYDQLFLNDQDVVDVLFYTQSWDRFDDFSDTIISNEKGILLVINQGVGEEVISGESNRLLRLELKAYNRDITINEFSVKRTGIGFDDDISEVSLEDSSYQKIANGNINNGILTFQPYLSITEGSTLILYIVVDVNSSAQAEHSVGFRILNNHDVVTDFGTVFIYRNEPDTGSHDNSYLMLIPDDVTIDGAFSDWEGKTIRNDTKWDVMRDDQDIIKYGLSETQDKAAFYLKVDGNILGGVEIPYWNIKTESDITVGEGSPRTGEDIIYIFIDKIPNYGYNDSLPFGADCMIEIQGRYNEITNANYYEWAGTDGSDWTWNQISHVDACLDMNELEVSISWDELAIDPHSDSFEVYYMATDWEELGQDYSDAEGVIEGPTR